jgi:hypothetical protein
MNCVATQFNGSALAIDTVYRLVCCSHREDAILTLLQESKDLGY